MSNFSPVSHSNCVAAFYAPNGTLVFGPVRATYADFRRLAEVDVPFGDPRAARDEQPTGILYILQDDNYLPLVDHKIVFSGCASNIMNGEYVIKQSPRPYGNTRRRRDRSPYWVLPFRTLAPERVYESNSNTLDVTGTIKFV